MLLDKKGRIAFKGHPMLREDMANDIDQLLNDKKLKGDGCVERNRLKDGNKQLYEVMGHQFEKIIKELDNYKVTAQELMKTLDVQS